MLPKDPQDPRQAAVLPKDPQDPRRAAVPPKDPWDPGQAALTLCQLLNRSPGAGAGK